jgi:hypothetical protein
VIATTLFLLDARPIQEVPSVTADTGPGHVMERLRGLQIPFITNRGQADEEVSYYADIFGGTFFVTRSGEMVYALRTGKSEVRSEKLEVGRVVLKERLVGSRAITPEGKDRAEARIHYFIGNDQGKWKTDLPTYDAVSMGEVYENIDLSLKAYGKKVEKVFTVHPGGKVGDIRLGFEGAVSLKTNAADELEVGVPCSAFPVPSSEFVVFSAPISFQEIDRKRK